MNPQQIESFKIFVNYSHIFFISLGVIKAVEFLMRAFILEEKNVPCWSQIIPFYNEYVWFKAFWKPLFFFIILGEFIFIYVFSIAGALFLGINQSNSSSPINTYQNTETAMGIVFIILFVILFLSLIIIGIMLYHKISKAFNHGVGFTIGLIFLNFIFTIILGVECIKKGVVSKISSGRKVFLGLWCTLIILLCVMYSFIYKTSMNQVIPRLAQALHRLLL